MAIVRCDCVCRSSLVEEESDEDIIHGRISSDWPALWAMDKLETYESEKIFFLQKKSS